MEKCLKMLLHERFCDSIAIKLRPKESCRQSANVLQKRTIKTMEKYLGNI